MIIGKKRKVKFLNFYIQYIIKKEQIQPSIQNFPLLGAEDEAAGLRKQLLRFHCISCDRPIEMHPNQM